MTPSLNDAADPPPANPREAVSADFSDLASADGKQFFYVKIPGNIGPLERGDRFEDPLHEALAAAGLGEVTGGGSQMAAGGGIDYCGLDVAVSDRDRGLALIVETMRTLNAPPGTVVEEYEPTRQDHPVFNADAQ